ncbi:MAG TPA: transaldolase family protein, partial [Gemmatimonadaceae bacterium]
FEDHGVVKRTLAPSAADAHALMRKLADGGIDFDDVTKTLEDEGIDKFEKSYAKLLRVIADKRRSLGVPAGR